MSVISIVQLVIAAALIFVLLFQGGGGGLGGIFGQPDTVYRTRRGVAKILFRLTIGLAAVFVILALVSLKF